MTQCDGSYSHSHGVLEWSIPLVDKTNSSGTLEFSAPGSADSFYPVNVNFNMNQPFCDIKVRILTSFTDTDEFYRSTNSSCLVLFLHYFIVNFNFQCTRSNLYKIIVIHVRICL